MSLRSVPSDSGPEKPILEDIVEKLQEIDDEFSNIIDRLKKENLEDSIDTINTIIQGQIDKFAKVLGLIKTFTDHTTEKDFKNMENILMMQFLAHSINEKFQYVKDALKNLRGKLRGESLEPMLKAGIVIVLPPGDKKVREFLRNKQEKYKTRIMQETESCIRDGVTNQKLIDYINRDQRYKLLLATELLAKGIVNIQQVMKSIEETDGIIYPEEFGNACEVIRDYIDTGGENVLHTSQMN